MNPLHQPARLRSLRPSNHWFAWVEQQQLLLGTALVLAGTIFFFAYNWAEMGRFAKLGLIEAALVTCLLAATQRCPVYLLNWWQHYVSPTDSMPTAR